MYLRLPRGAAWDAIPAETLEDCVTLVKANSIEGSKLARCDVVYTPWSNLRKTASMAVGQVGLLPFALHHEHQLQGVWDKLSLTWQILLL